MDPWSGELAGAGRALVDAVPLAAADLVTATTGAAVAMLAVMAVVAALLGWFAWTLFRRSRRPDPTLAFLDDLDRGREPCRRDATRPADPGRAAWERPHDWWKD
jgi:hypothetical protein